MPGNVEEKNSTKTKVRGKKRNIGELIKEATAENKYYMGQLVYIPLPLISLLV